MFLLINNLYAVCRDSQLFSLPASWAPRSSAGTIQWSGEQRADNCWGEEGREQSRQMANSQERVRRGKEEGGKKRAKKVFSEKLRSADSRWETRIRLPWLSSPQHLCSFLWGLNRRLCRVENTQLSFCFCETYLPSAPTAELQTMGCFISKWNQVITKAKKQLHTRSINTGNLDNTEVDGEDAKSVSDTLCHLLNSQLICIIFRNILIMHFTFWKLKVLLTGSLTFLYNSRVEGLTVIFLTGV